VLHLLKGFTVCNIVEKRKPVKIRLRELSKENMFQIGNDEQGVGDK
jgi:hypothetical protein